MTSGILVWPFWDAEILMQQNHESKWPRIQVASNHYHISVLASSIYNWGPHVTDHKNLFEKKF